MAPAMGDRAQRALERVIVAGRTANPLFGRESYRLFEQAMDEYRQAYWEDIPDRSAEFDALMRKLKEGTSDG